MKPVPCKCGLWPFPHRASRKCGEHENQIAEQREQDQIEAQDHAADLRAWANLSRG